MFRDKDYFTSASRRNNGNYGYGWCSSSAPLNITDFYMQFSPARWTDMNAYLLTVKIANTFNSSEVAPQEPTIARQAMCEP